MKIQNFADSHLSKLEIPSIHKAGWIFIFPTLALILISRTFSKRLSNLFVVVATFFIYFFRDPIRSVPDSQEAIVSPADGIVSLITKSKLPDELKVDDHRQYTRVSIFLNVFNVHIQRIPISGLIESVCYREGKFLNASLDKASTENERSSTLIKLDSGQKIAVVQIAGLIARRIVNELEPARTVKTGEKYGIIRFGSRVDVYLPPEIETDAYLGLHTIAGETIIATLNKTVQ